MSTGIVDPQFVYLELSADSSDEIFERIGSDLTKAGRTKSSFVAALKKREANFPTGLPVPGGVAIPHADAEHVNIDTIAIATLAQPVTFAQMAGEESDTVEVSTVLLLALSDADKQIGMLPAMIGCIQDPQFLASLRSSGDPSTVADIANNSFDK